MESGLDSIGMNTQPKNGQTMSPFSIPKMPGKRTRRNLFFHFKLVEVRDIPARNDVFESLLCCCCSRHSRRCFSSSEFVQRRLLPKLFHGLSTNLDFLTLRLWRIISQAWGQGIHHKFSTVRSLISCVMVGPIVFNVGLSVQNLFPRVSLIFKMRHVCTTRTCASSSPRPMPTFAALRTTKLSNLPWSRFRDWNHKTEHTLGWII